MTSWCPFCSLPTYHQNPPGKNGGLLHSKGEKKLEEWPRGQGCFGTGYAGLLWVPTGQGEAPQKREDFHLRGLWPVETSPNPEAPPTWRNVGSRTLCAGGCGCP